MITLKNKTNQKKSHQSKKLTLDMPFISLNEYIDVERTSKYMAADLKKQQTFSVNWLIKEQKFTLEPGKYDVIFNWIKPNEKKDHDNICFAKKFILDGLVIAKVIPSDGSKFIGDFQDKFIPGKTKNYVWCIVEFVKA